MRVARKCAGNVLYRERTRHALLSPERLPRRQEAAEGAEDAEDAAGEAAALVQEWKEFLQDLEQMKEREDPQIRREIEDARERVRELEAQGDPPRTVLPNPRRHRARRRSKAC